MNGACLAGRVAIVTGGGRGIGRAIAVGLAANGADVVLASRTPGPCEAVAETIREAGGTALAVVADVASHDDRCRLIEQAVEAYGRIDVLVNNAGLLRPHLTVKVSEEELDELMAVNLKGPVFLSKLAAPHMDAAGGGSIINISALGAFQPMEGIGAYCAVKAAMVNWTVTMAKEWAPLRIRVNTLVPGPVATEMILPRDPVARERFITEMSSKTFSGRLAEPEDLVDGVIFLASDSSSLMSGRSMFLDGGMLA